MSVCIIKKSHPLYNFWRWFYTRDWIAYDGETIEGVRIDEELLRPGRTQPIIKNKKKYKKKRDIPAGMKYCTACKQILPKEDFYGGCNICKPCKSIKEREYYRRKKEENPAPQKPRKKPTRVCRQCGETKFLTEFYSKGFGRGPKSICKECDNRRRALLAAASRMVCVELQPRTNEEYMIMRSEAMDKFKSEIVYYGDDAGRAE